MNRWGFLISIMIIFVLALGFIWFHRYQEPTHIEIRAALDIGSGATNLKVARVDRETDKIISKIFEQSIPVPYQKHLEQSADQTFDREVMDQGIRAIQTLKDLANQHQAKKVVAVATAAFRKAQNAPQFVEEIEQKTGVRVRIIDQDEEGVLAFRGALAVTPVMPQQAVVWDIGGGSMQLTTLTEDGSYLIEKGKTASIPFKNAIIQDIKQRDIHAISSPNPLSIEEMGKAIQYGARQAQDTDPYIKEKLHRPNTKVLAVGNLFNFGVRPLVNNDVVQRDQLKNAVLKWADKADEELPGGSLVEVTVTNPLLVLGFMEGLNIPSVTVVNINNADGALTYPPYWGE